MITIPLSIVSADYLENYKIEVAVHNRYAPNFMHAIYGIEFDNTVTRSDINDDERDLMRTTYYYNHDFYFNGMSSRENAPSEMLSERIDRDFGSMEEFKTSFLDTASELFGSGWVWLSIDKKSRLLIEACSNADNPLLDGHVPLMTCDVWEHAYYIDYRNARAEYLKKWWKLINWDFVSENLSKSHYIEFPCDEYSGACEFREDKM